MYLTLVYSRRSVNMNSLHSLEFPVIIVHEVPATVQCMVLFKITIILVFKKSLGYKLTVTYFAL